MLSNSSKAARNSWASCWAYPKNLDFLLPIAFLSSEGVYERDDDDLINLTVLAYASATLAPEFSYLT